MSTGEGDQAGVLIVDQGERFKLAQAIYSAITEKTEKLARSHSVDCVVTKADLDQLDAKCQQACSQWQVLSSSTSITVHHTDDNKEQFSSYKRFEIYDSSKTAPVESVVYERDMLLALPGVPKPQPYKVTVRILSRVAMFKRMDREMSPPAFFRFFHSGGIVVEVEYVDYVVARNLLATIDSWVAEVEQIADWQLARRLHPVTHWIPRISMMALVGIALAATIGVTPAVLTNTSTLADLGRWLLFAGAFVWIAGAVARVIGHWVELSIDNIVAISAIRLNKGDERLIAEFRTKNKWRVVRGLAGVVLVFAQGIAINAITPTIVAWFSS